MEWISLIVGLLSLLIAIWQTWDARDQRKKKNKALALIEHPLHEARGAVISFKGYVSDQAKIKAMDDLIGRIDAALKKAESIS